MRTVSDINREIADIRTQMRFSLGLTQQRPNEEITIGEFEGREIRIFRYPHGYPNNDDNQKVVLRVFRVYQGGRRIQQGDEHQIIEFLIAASNISDKWCISRRYQSVSCSPIYFLHFSKSGDRRNDNIIEVQYQLGGAAAELAQGCLSEGMENLGMLLDLIRDEGFLG